MGNTGVVDAGEVQVMSAGTGVAHSEYNHSQTDAANTLQILLFPKERNIQPRYDQKSFIDLMKHNQLTTLISPVKGADTMWINQDATFSMGVFDAKKAIKYEIKTTGNGVYVFVLEGIVNIDGSILNKRDALRVYNTSSITIETETESRLLIMDVPML